jgi:hypothetical protein
MTLAEHDAMLKATGQYDAMVEKNRQQEQERQERVGEWREAEQPLVAELRAAGFAVESAWDLFNRKEPWNTAEDPHPYTEALPILLEHLKRPYPDRVREGVARALAVPGIRFGWETLVWLYRQEPFGTDAKSGLAVAIGATADDEVMGEVIALLNDSRHGPSRVLLLSALGRSSLPSAREALVALESDPQLAREVEVLLRRSK